MMDLHLSSKRDNLSQDVGQFLPGLHGSVEKRAGKVDGERVVAVFENVITLLQIISVQNLVLSENGKQCHFE